MLFRFSSAAFLVNGKSVFKKMILKSKITSFKRVRAGLRIPEALCEH